MGACRDYDDDDDVTWKLEILNKKQSGRVIRKAACFSWHKSMTSNVVNSPASFTQGSHHHKNTEAHGEPI